VRLGSSFVGVDDDEACTGGTGEEPAAVTEGETPAGCQRTNESGH
jgi:hypothetical protein